MGRGFQEAGAERRGFWRTAGAGDQRTGKAAEAPNWQEEGPRHGGKSWGAWRRRAAVGDGALTVQTS